MLTIPDQSYLLVRQVVAPIPACGVHLLATEIVQPLDLRPCRLVELPNGRHEKVALDLILRAEFGFFAARRCRDFRSPFLELIIPSGLLYRRVESDVRVKLVLLSDPDQVGQDLLLSRVLSLMGTRGQLLHLSLMQLIYAHRPIAVLREAIAVKRR